MSIILKGINETGRKEDAEKIVRFLGYEDIRIRMLALNAICKLNPKNSIDYILDRIISDDECESKNARICLENRISLLNGETIIELLDLVGYKDHVYVNLLKLINRFSKWTALELLLNTFRLLGVNYTELINQEIELWVEDFNRSFIKPSKEQVEAIRKLYMMQSNKIDNRNKRELGSMLENY